MPNSGHLSIVSRRVQGTLYIHYLGTLNRGKGPKEWWRLPKVEDTAWEVLLWIYRKKKKNVGSPRSRLRTEYGRWSVWKVITGNPGIGVGKWDREEKAAARPQSCWGPLGDSVATISYPPRVRKLEYLCTKSHPTLSSPSNSASTNVGQRLPSAYSKKPSQHKGAVTSQSYRQNTNSTCYMYPIWNSETGVWAD